MSEPATHTGAVAVEVVANPGPQFTLGIYELIIAHCARPRPQAGTVASWADLHQHELTVLMRVNSDFNALAAKHLYTAVVCDRPDLLVVGSQGDSLKGRISCTKRHNLGLIVRLNLEPIEELKSIITELVPLRSTAKDLKKIISSRLVDGREVTTANTMVYTGANTIETKLKDVEGELWDLMSCLERIRDDQYDFVFDFLEFLTLSNPFTRLSALAIDCFSGYIDLPRSLVYSGETRQMASALLDVVYVLKPRHVCQHGTSGLLTCAVPGGTTRAQVSRLSAKYGTDWNFEFNSHCKIASRAGIPSSRRRNVRDHLEKVMLIIGADNVVWYDASPDDEYDWISFFCQLWRHVGHKAMYDRMMIDELESLRVKIQVVVLPNTISQYWHKVFNSEDLRPNVPTVSSFGSHLIPLFGLWMYLHESQVELGDDYRKKISEKGDSMSILPHVYRWQCMGCLAKDDPDLSDEGREFMRQYLDRATHFGFGGGTVYLDDGGYDEGMIGSRIGRIGTRVGTTCTNGRAF